MKKLVLASAASALLAIPAMGWAHGSCTDDPEHCVYWHTSDGTYVKDSAGDCVKTSAWFPGTQIEGCDVIIKEDTDGDGVVDEKDHCPDTPAGAPVDAVGCPTDSDWDGVPDYMDKCPDTPTGAEVDEVGCEVKPVVMMKTTLGINFAFDSATVTSAYGTDVAEIARVMKEVPEATLTIEGHTDSVGPEAYNMDLSQRRADAAKALLVDEGISSDRIEAVGYGESRPIADNATSEGRRMNRRVDALVHGVAK